MNKPYFIYRDGLLYMRKLTGVSARRVVNELIKMGHKAYFVYDPNRP